MEAQLLKKDGNILFMETESAVADMLTRILQAPLGAVVGAVGDGGPLATLQQSMHRLREPIFTTPKEKTLVKAMDIESQVGSPPKAAPVGVPISHANIQVASKGNGAWSFTSNASAWYPAAFTSIQGDSFEVVLRTQSGNCMIGVAPKSQIHSKLTQANIYTSCGYFMHLTAQTVLYAQDGTSGKATGLPCSPGDLVTMKFIGGANPSLAFSMRQGDMSAVTFNQAIPANEPMCPVIMMYSNITCTVEKIEGESSQACKAVLHPVAKFLISNDFEICESSSLKAVQLMQKQNIELSGLEVDSVTIKPEHVKRILARALMGKKDVLQYAFNEDASCEGSEQSFVMS